MGVLAEIQPRVYALTGGLFANWMPPDPVDVGDFGVIAHERFVRDGNLRNWGLEFAVEETRKSDGKLDYSDRAKVAIRMSAQAAVGVASQSSPTASAHIEFTGQGAFLYHLSGFTIRRLQNTRAFFEDLARKWIAGAIKLEENSVIVNEIRIVDDATIIVSEGHEGSLDLIGEISAAQDAVLADVKGGLSVANSFGNMFKWLSTRGTIPVIGLVRPIMGPPGGGSPSALVSFVRQVQDLFKVQRMDIRTVRLDFYAPKNELPTVTAHLPDGSSVVVGFQAITAEEFFALDATAGQKESFVDETVPTVRVSGARAAGAGA